MRVGCWAGLFRVDIIGRFQRRGVYKRLKDGARLTESLGDPIVLACRIVGPSNQGFDFARVWVERNQAGLRLRPVFRIFALLIARGELLLDKRETLRDGFDGGSLK